MHPQLTSSRGKPISHRFSTASSTADPVRKLAPCALAAASPSVAAADVASAAPAAAGAGGTGSSAAAGTGTAVAAAVGPLAGSAGAVAAPGFSAASAGLGAAALETNSTMNPDSSMPDDPTVAESSAKILPLCTHAARRVVWACLLASPARSNHNCAAARSARTHRRTAAHGHACWLVSARMQTVRAAVS
eukprot:365042-Chlamydomonas_euryale.AAC.20